MESRETSGMVSRQFNLIEIHLEYIQRRRTRQFIAQIGRNRPISLINGHDETVHHEPLQLSPGRPILINGPDEL